jgi:hypothetical protein
MQASRPLFFHLIVAFERRSVYTTMIGLLRGRQVGTEFDRFAQIHVGDLRLF